MMGRDLTILRHAFSTARPRELLGAQFRASQTVDTIILFVVSSKRERARMTSPCERNSALALCCLGLTEIQLRFLCRSVNIASAVVEELSILGATQFVC